MAEGSYNRGKNRSARFDHVLGTLVRLVGGH
jgi:hypothetical protein